LFDKNVLCEEVLVQLNYLKISLKYLTVWLYFKKT